MSVSAARAADLVDLARGRGGGCVFLIRKYVTAGRTRRGRKRAFATRRLGRDYKRGVARQRSLRYEGERRGTRIRRRRLERSARCCSESARLHRLASSPREIKKTLAKGSRRNAEEGARRRGGARASASRKPGPLRADTPTRIYGCLRHVRSYARENRKAQQRAREKERERERDAPTSLVHGPVPDAFLCISRDLYPDKQPQITTLPIAGRRLLRLLRERRVEHGESIGRERVRGNRN